MSVLSLIGRLSLFKVVFEEGGSETGVFTHAQSEADVHTGANAVSSKHGNGKSFHAVLLDLDVPAYLIPSSTPGHSHLYIDVDVPQTVYFRLLDALADAGVIERGYAQASKAKGGTFLRLPWVKKSDNNREAVPF